MANGLGEMELELEGLGEFEHELEAEMPEAFGWSDAKNWARRQWSAVQTPGSWQRKALLAADKAALVGGPTLIGTALGGPGGGLVGSVVGSGLAGALVPDREFEFESEFESEFENELESELELEGEYEAETFVNPVSRAYPDAMMENLGRAAMEAENEFEAAEHFLPLIPLVASKLLPLAAKALPRIAGRVLPRVARAITRATPRMTRSVTHLTRTLHRDPRTRPLVRVVPSIARRAMTTVARRAATGRPVSPQDAVRILARENHRVLSNPRMVGAVLRRSDIMDRRYRRLRGSHYPLGSHPYGAGGLPARRLGGWGGRRVCPTCGRPVFPGSQRACCCC